MYKIGGVVKKFDGTAIDYVSIFKWINGKCLKQVAPDAAGNWHYPYSENHQVGLTYVADGCQPITHGPYSMVELASPLPLFESGVSGAWYDVGDITTLYQDVGRTIPVTKSGDPVALVLDKSGNNNHLVQSVNSRRPVYRDNMALPYIEFDGISQILVSKTALDLSTGDISFFLSYASTQVSATQVASLAGPLYQGITIDTNVFHTRPVVETSDFAVSIPYQVVTKPRVISATLDKGTRQYIGYTDGAYLGKVTVPGTSWYEAPSFVVVGANRYILSPAPAYGNVRFYGALVAKKLFSASDRAIVDQYLAVMSGANVI